MAIVFEPFDIDNEGNVRPTKEVLGYGPFHELWTRDDSKQKSRAIADFSYIHYFTCPKKSNHYFTEDEESGRKQKSIIKDIKFIPNDYRPDALVNDAIDFLTEKYDQVFAVAMLKDLVEGANKLRKFCRNVDLEQLNPKGTSTLYKPKEISDIISNMDELMVKLKKAEELAHESFKKASKYSQNKEPGYYEL